MTDKPITYEQIRAVADELKRFRIKQVTMRSDILDIAFGNHLLAVLGINIGFGPVPLDSVAEQCGQAANVHARWIQHFGDEPIADMIKRREVSRD